MFPCSFYLLYQLMKYEKNYLNSNYIKKSTLSTIGCIYIYTITYSSYRNDLKELNCQYFSIFKHKLELKVFFFINCEMVYKKLILFKLENNLGFFSFKYWLKKCMNVSYYSYVNKLVW